MNSKNKTPEIAALTLPWVILNSEKRAFVHTVLSELICYKPKSYLKDFHKAYVLDFFAVHFLFSSTLLSEDDLDFPETENQDTTLSLHLYVLTVNFGLNHTSL